MSMRNCCNLLSLVVNCGRQNFSRGETSFTFSCSLCSLETEFISIVQQVTRTEKDKKGDIINSSDIENDLIKTESKYPVTFYLFRNRTISKMKIDNGEVKNE